MSNRIDQLFKNKLSEHHLPPSEEAWAKVQNGLSKKNKAVIYWRAAAVFVLMGLLVSAWYLLTPPIENTDRQLSKTENTETQERPAIPQEKETESTYSQLADKKESNANDTRKHLALREKKNTLQKKEELKEEFKVPAETESQIELEEIDQAITVAEVATEKPMVIEFTLPTIEESTPAPVSVANSETEKSTGIMKFLETARDVKNGDAEFGNSLRDIKNELLAFEFKKDKTRRN